MTTLQKKGEQPLTQEFGPNYAEKCRWIGPGGHLCRFDNALQDEDTTGVAMAENSHHHPAPNAGTPTPPPPPTRVCP